MSRQPNWLVLFLFAFAITALGATFYFGMQKESATILPTRSAPADLKAKKKAVVVWAYGSTGASDALLTAASSWEETLDQKVDIRVFPTRVEYETARIIAARDKRMPDIFFVSAEEAEYLDRTDVLQRVPLSSIAVEHWRPQVLAPFVRGNALLAYPSQYSLLALYYNPADFDRISVAYPDASWNWETLTSISRALYKPSQGGRPPHYGLEMPLTAELWNAFAAQAGHALYDGQTWLLGIPEFLPAQKEALGYIIDLQQAYRFCAPKPPEGKPLYFVQGSASLLIGGPELRKAFSGNPDLKWAVAPLPDKNALEAGKAVRATPLRVFGWAISAKVAHPEDAMKVAEKLSEVTFDGWLPARVGAADTETVVFSDSLAKSLPPFIHPQAGRAGEILNGLLATLPAAPTNPDKFMAKVKVGLDDLDLDPPQDGKK